ncbi:hypothetical protein TYRP_019658 [Tyrophagus putrescentiae]|nr:hypothetical protein TYRP_019658 [Tyrophagus putrescentiae]
MSLVSRGAPSLTKHTQLSLSTEASARRIAHSAAVVAAVGQFDLLNDQRVVGRHQRRWIVKVHRQQVTVVVAIVAGRLGVLFSSLPLLLFLLIIFVLLILFIVAKCFSIGGLSCRRGVRFAWFGVLLSSIRIRKGLMSCWVLPLVVAYLHGILSRSFGFLFFSSSNSCSSFQSTCCSLLHLIFAVSINGN